MHVGNISFVNEFKNFNFNTYKIEQIRLNTYVHR